MLHPLSDSKDNVKANHGSDVLCAFSSFMASFPFHPQMYWLHPMPKSKYGKHDLLEMKVKTPAHVEPFHVESLRPCSGLLDGKGKVGSSYKCPIFPGIEIDL